MQEASIAQMGEQEKTYWWHVSCRAVWQTVLHKFLPNDPARSIVDVGCGGGINLTWLKQFGRVEGVDTSSLALDYAKQYGTVRLGDAFKLPYLNRSQGLVTAFDVLEHLPDDLAALREWNRVLAPGGYIFISVPAYQWLFGPRDTMLMHYRRYSRAQLTRAAIAAGFKPIFTSYLFMFTFPIFVLQRLLTKALHQSAGYNPAPSLINHLLIGLGRLEARLVKFTSLPFGSSVLILAKKL